MKSDAMQIAVVGIKGNLSLREKASKELFVILKELSSHMSIIPLVTCNRFEIYFTCDDVSKGFDVLFQIIKQKEFEQYFYGYFGKDCFNHLCKTAVGLNSVIVGESEIQRQVKKAYVQYSDTQLPFVLHYLFQKSLMVSKQIRTQFFLKPISPRLENILLKSIKHHCSFPKVLFVGNSEINRTILKYFKKCIDVECVLSSRFAVSADVKILHWSNLDRWVEFDVVICGSKYQGFCIHPRNVKKKIQIFDLSVPRCVNPEVVKDRNVSLKNIDEVYRMINSRKTVFEEKCEAVIHEKIEKLIKAYEKKEKSRLFFQKAAG